MWIVPSYRRPKSLARLIEVCKRTAPEVKMVVRLHEGDPFEKEYAALNYPENWEVVTGPQQRASGALQHIFRLFPNEKSYGFIADDIITNTKNWDKLLERKAGEWCLAYPDDGVHGKALCTHFCIGGKLVRNVGWLGPSWIDHNYIDNTWYAVAYGLEILRYCPEVEFEHLHPGHGKAEKDFTYDLGMKNYDKDEAAFKEWGEADYEKLIRRLEKKVPRHVRTRYYSPGKIHVAVCIPTAGLWRDVFGLSLASMVQHFEKYQVGNVEGQKLTLLTSKSSMLCWNRETLLRNIYDKAEEVTHVLWLDDDMTFPRDTLHRLLLHDKDFVAGQGVTKEVPADPTATGMDGFRCYSDPEKQGLQEIKHVGLAVALMKAKPEVREMKEPWFEQKWQEEVKAPSGEDVFFCHRLRDELKMRLYVDHELSRQIGHIGAFEFTHDLVGRMAEKEAS